MSSSRTSRRGFVVGRALISSSVIGSALVGSALVGSGCAGPYKGPDKQFAGTAEGALTGAGAGAVTGFQVGAGTGPGALVGAGVGAVAGGIEGAVRDSEEEQLINFAAEKNSERARAFAQEQLVEHYKTRMELHPTRDIFPADIFFDGDSVELRPGARGLVRELALLNKHRVPWSRLVVAAYVKSAGPDNSHAQRVAERRSREIGDCLIANGLEPRRVMTRAVVIKDPLLIDPQSTPGRYSQAIELIPIDR